MFLNRNLKFNKKRTNKRTGLRQIVALLAVWISGIIGLSQPVAQLSIHNGATVTGDTGKLEAAVRQDKVVSGNIARQNQSDSTTVEPASVQAQIDIVGPPGSGAFGTTVTVLPNGNFVVTDPFYDDGAVSDAGAVYLYNGVTLTVISVIKGGSSFDRVGSKGITVLSNSNYVVSSSEWDNPSGSLQNAGAVTWCNGTVGTNGVVSAANSLIGGTASDRVGDSGIAALTNGNYVVSTASWDNPSPATANVGAVTFGNGTGGTIGTINSANSLIGTTHNQVLGNNGVIVLNNGNYLVNSSEWSNPLVPFPTGANVGAVTFGNGTSGTVGTISSSNSLIGLTDGDFIGTGGITVLTNGNYVVNSPAWDNPSTGKGNVGAVTWCNGATGRTGAVSDTNSLVGVVAGQQVGVSGVTALTNGNYVVSTGIWVNPALPFPNNAGAVTFCDGTTGRTGVVSAANSLIGSSESALVGSGGVTALTNGNYVVRSFEWSGTSSATTLAGAITWCNGTTGRTGIVSAANSLIGSTADLIGNFGIIPLRNGNYVVRSSSCTNPLLSSSNDAGAITFCDGTMERTGTVTPSNSLVGATVNEQLGRREVTALSNGNYVVNSPEWDNPSPVLSNVGAVTWCSGTTSTSGTINASNSLTGTAGSTVGSGGIAALTNGNYVVNSPRWNNPSPMLFEVGAVTWCDGMTGRIGQVSATNSLIGGFEFDKVGSGGVTALSNGSYVVSSPEWADPILLVGDVEAVTWGNGAVGTVGQITTANSVLGTVANGISAFPAFSHDTLRHRLFVGRDRSNIVSILFFEQTRTLSVTSSNPASGVNFTVSPSDINGLGNGTAPLTRIYNDGASVTLTAPATADGKVFQKWQRDGVDFAFTQSTTVTMDANHTLTAVYVCGVTINLSSQTFSAAGGNGNFNVITDAGCSWTATTNAPWITINGGSGTGNGTVSYTAADNGLIGNRTGTIIVANQTFTVLQGAAFFDVPANHPFYNEIGKLSARGVTLGCGNGNYCPDAVVTRDQMAAFIMRARGEFNPPAPGSQRFNDVPPSNPFYAFVDRMAQLQITLGCGGGNYCPNNSVLREQMAAFLIRALHEPGYIPPAPSSQRFNDVPPSHAFYAHIEEMATRAITLGCSSNPPLYCPGNEVTRAQMAAFLVRAFNL